MPDLEAAVQAHRAKEEQAEVGLVPHSVFNEHDVALREVQDGAEVERVAAYQEAGHVAAPGVGDYHAVRRVSKQIDALEGTMGEAGAGREQRVETTRSMIEQARETAGEARRQAAQTRENAERVSPQGRASRQGVMETATGPTTGGLMQGSAEGASKSASSTGTASDDLDIDASTPGGPGRAGGLLDTDQTSGEQTESGTGRAKQGGGSDSGDRAEGGAADQRRTRGGRGGSGGKQE
jgi:hypothetical protein